MTVNMYEWHHVWHCEYIAMKEMDIIFVPWWFARLSTTSLTHPPERKKQLVLKCIDLKTLFFLKKKKITFWGYLIFLINNYLQILYKYLNSAADYTTDADHTTNINHNTILQ